MSAAIISDPSNCHIGVAVAIIERYLASFLFMPLNDVSALRSV